MTLTLTSGGESRMDGAPDQLLPPYEDKVEALAQALLAEDQDGVYGGDINMAREAARMQLGEMSARSQASQQAAAKAGADRAKTRAARQGVVPESLPPGEFGVASGREVQEYNRPVEEAEAVLGMQQEAADAITRGLREDQRNWQAEGDYAYLQERGERNPLAPVGQRDLDLRRSIMQRRGQHFEMPDGTVIPVGRDPTAADLRNEREWQDWTNETPGSERQARYNPQGYEEFREGVREDIQDQARRDMRTYGTGPTSGVAPFQEENRRNRAAAEDRTAEAEREVRIARLARRAGVGMAEARKMMDEGRAEAGGAAGRPLTAAERRLESQSLRDLGTDRRNQELSDRRQSRINQARLAGGQPTGGPGGTRAAYEGVMFQRNRFDELINRLGEDGMNNWQRAGVIAGLTSNAQTANPTPLGVEAVGAQNAVRMMNAELLAGQDPGVRGMRELQAAAAEAALDLPVRADRERDANNGVLPANSPAGQAMLADIASTVIGSTYTTDWEYNRAVERAVAEGIPRADAEAYFRRHAQGTNSGLWGWILGAGVGGAETQPTAALPPAVGAASPPPPASMPPPGIGMPAPVQTPRGRMPGGTPWSRM